MKSPVFTFLGVVESRNTPDIRLLKSQLEIALAPHVAQLTFETREEHLLLTQIQPHFRFYITFVNNDPNTLAEWKDLAKNFELPWDIKLVNKKRLADIFARVEKEGWPKYNPSQQFAYIILDELEKFQQVRIFTIPSMGKPTLWNRIVGRY